MILRLRSRDGLERIEVPDTASVSDLRSAVHTKLSIPLEDIQVSRHPELLTTKTPCEMNDMAVDRAPLQSLGVAHGDMLYLLYAGERDVEPVVRKSVFESRKFGERNSVADVLALQTRIERQDKAKVDLLSFDHQSANVFQQYIQGALSFSIQRGGILYGTVDEEGSNVTVDFVYEPPQEGGPLSLKMSRGGLEEQQVDFLAGLLGLKKVGIIFNQSKAPRDYIFSSEELLLSAAAQDEMGEHAVTVIVSMDNSAEGGGQVHFEVFQCSAQCVQLAKTGWMLAPQSGVAPSGVTKMVNPSDLSVTLPVIVASKDLSEVDNDYFLCPARIVHHDGKLSTAFPVENRLLPQGRNELKEYLRKSTSKSYVEKVSDLHLLLWLSKQPNLDPNDMLLLCDAVKEGKPVLEGYRVIIDSIAGL